MAEINQRVEGTNLFVFSKDAETGNFVYSMPFSFDEARELANATNREIRSYDAKGLKGVELYADEKTSELVRMSALKGILANNTLMDKQGKWFPTISEGLELQRNGLYCPGILIDHGIALYSENGTDEEIAKALTATANEQGIALPVLASFKSLGLQEGGERYGVMPQIVSAEGLIQGKDAEKVLRDNFKRAGSFSVRRLARDAVGDWVANWLDYLDGFDRGYRIGRFSAEGSEQNLRSIIQEEIRTNYSPRRSKLENELKALSAQEKATIESAEKVLA